MTDLNQSSDARNEERAFLDAYSAAAFDRLSLTVDVALLTVDAGCVRVLLVRRSEHPAKGMWSLPGGFVRIDESLEDAASRVVREKAGLESVFIEQLYTFGSVGRDPRTRVVSVSYYALVDAERLCGAMGPGSPGRSMAKVEEPVRVLLDGIPDPVTLAFDHADILTTAIGRVRGKLDYCPIGFQLLPPTFTLRQLQDIHEVLLGRRLNKDAFRRRMLASGQLAPTGQREEEVGHRPAELYRFTERSAV